jgi:hypothetical protein
VYDPEWEMVSSIVRVDATTIHKTQINATIFNIFSNNITKIYHVQKQNIINLNSQNLEQKQQ